MKLDSRSQRKSYESQFYRMQGQRRHPIRGILIYEQARRKLDISEDGHLYRQKWFSFLPVVGPTLSMIYAHYCLGKVKCLRRKDEMLFRKAKSSIRLFGFFFWPLIFLGLWTLLSYISTDFSINTTNGGLLDNSYIYGYVGSYASNWENLFYQPLANCNDAGQGIMLFFGGLAKLFIFPLLPGPEYGFGNTHTGCNIIFIIIIILLTVLNPVNIYNTFALNRPVLRFTIVFETSNIYRYRNP